MLKKVIGKKITTIEGIAVECEMHPIQNFFALRVILSDILELPINRVRVIKLSIV
jgi:hypothetical protein